MGLGVEDAPVGHRVHVGYSVWGARREMQDTFPVVPGERRLKAGLITVRRLGIMGGPGLVVLTDKRLCFLVHYFFRFDRGFELPRGSLISVRRITLLPTIWFLRLTYRTPEGTSHLDISDVQVLTVSTARMGQPVKAQHLVDAIRKGWGSDAPLD